MNKFKKDATGEKIETHADNNKEQKRRNTYKQFIVYRFYWSFTNPFQEYRTDNIIMHQNNQLYIYKKYISWVSFFTFKASWLSEKVDI